MPRYKSVKHLFEAARIAAMDSQAKIKYIHMIDRERDLRNQFQFASNKEREEYIAVGIDTGRAEGGIIDTERDINKGRLLIAKQLKDSGVSCDIIARSTGLSLEEIEVL